MHDEELKEWFMDHRELVVARDAGQSIRELFPNRDETVRRWVRGVQQFADDFAFDCKRDICKDFVRLLGELVVKKILSNKSKVWSGLESRLANRYHPGIDLDRNDLFGFLQELFGDVAGTRTNF